MPVEFLIGAAGSGKTRRCVEQIREMLKASPEGPSLLWIAPKQSTFQLERQVLADRAAVRGFTRLEILPFDRLARRILEALGQPVREVLSEDGRVMVLRALLLEHSGRLKAFRTCARAPGFPVQLSQVLREMQRAGSGSMQLRNIYVAGSSAPALSAKLADLALLLEAYVGWLRRHHLGDSDDLLRLAAVALVQARRTGQAVPVYSHLWLDGFAEMTLPELDLLAALLPACDDAVLAFCLDRAPGPKDPATGTGEGSAVGAGSLWGVTAATYLRCFDRVKTLGLTPRIRLLPEGVDGPPRFRSAPDLARLASDWTRLSPGAVHAGRSNGSGVCLVECADPEAEAMLAVRLIHDHVGRRSGRFRDISVIVRRMDGYGDVLQRAFRRHEIPFFADHREPMGHHPVAELTRNALRMAATGWAHEEWLSTLKTGLVVDNPVLVDNLENAALRGGATGDAWLRLEEYAAQIGLSEDAVRSFARPIAAYREFQASFTDPVNGRDLAAALGTLWKGLRVPQTLERWQSEAGDLPPLYRAIHHTAWEQIRAWSQTLALAFVETELGARDWLAIADSGLSHLTLGVIPPALDQVLVGAVDRARQPEVKLTLVLGLNEGVFPAPPPAPALLNRADRQILAEGGIDLGWSPLQIAARENYYAYIACTRSEERLCVAWSRRGLDGKTVVRSSAAERVLELLGWPANQPAEPGDATSFDGRLRAFSGSPDPLEARSLSELFECPGWDRALPATGAMDTPAHLAARQVSAIREQLVPAAGQGVHGLAAESVEALHPGGVLVSSVSALEDFALCPFQHFASRQLRLEQRPEFKPDPATLGTLLHEILRQFHETTMAEKGNWRSWNPSDAADRIRQTGEALLKRAEFAPLARDPAVAWESRQRIDGLAAAVTQMVAWLVSCEFEPVLSEFRFGAESGSGAAAWTLGLEGGRMLKLRGSIDRIDVCRLPDGRILLAVLDYKSTAAAPRDERIEFGFDLQLLGYLAFATASTDVREAVTRGAPTAAQIHPAGAFQVPVTPRIKTGERDDDNERRMDSYLDSLSHLGRGVQEWRENFDTGTKDGTSRRCSSRQFRPGNFVGAAKFQELLEGSTEFLKRHASAILAGAVHIRPVRFGLNDTACDFCSFRALCRFEPLLSDFRTVKSLQPGAAPGGADEVSDQQTRPLPDTPTPEEVR